MNAPLRSRVAIACQGGGSHTAFTAGVLHELLGQMPDDVEIVAISGTSGGAICAAGSPGTGSSATIPGAESRSSSGSGRGLRRISPGIG
ncbi:MAG: hypothetical protein U0794_16895 [Isosphaeraceae bacterium]